MDNPLKKTLSIKIKRLDMFPNHFFGIAKIDEDYKINIQGHGREKLIKLPIKFKDEKVNDIMNTIADAVCTNSKGDGKIFVSNIEESMDICTKEKGIHTL